MLTVVLSPALLAKIDVMPQHITFPAEYLIAQVLSSLHRYRISLSQDAARGKLHLPFENSRCHTARSVTDEMAKLRCKRGAHPPYSPDVALRDISLFSRVKDHLAGFHANDDAELLRTVQGILKANTRSQANNAFLSSC
jgi:hypothetical protein